MVQPVLIDPTAVYDDSSLILSLGLTPAAMSRARKEKKIRFTKQGNRVLYLGQWVLDWLASDTEPAPKKELAHVD